jgi:catechol 2,3-dioxygenase-like lactoylglutathione lyase family enzyme
MAEAEFPAPEQGFVLTHFLVVTDQDRSREWYVEVFDAAVLVERSPVILQAANSWIILNEGGGPTPDKPEVFLETPADPNRVSAFLNVRVADIQAMRDKWRQKGVEFLTDPVEFASEIRGYLRDPDGHLIEVGQSTSMPGN